MTKYILNGKGSFKSFGRVKGYFKFVCNVEQTEEVRLCVSRSALKNLELSFVEFPSLKLLRKLDVGAIRDLLKFFINAVKEGKVSVDKTEKAGEVIYTLSLGDLAKAEVVKYVEG